MMKFIAEQLSANGGRLGQLSGLQSSPHAVHLTPMVVLTTQVASLPHITEVCPPHAVHLTPMVVLTTQVASLPHITEVKEIIELFGYNGSIIMGRYTVSYHV